MEFKTKSQIVREKGLTSYLHGFDDEHVYLVIDGKEYAHPNSLGRNGPTLPEQYWKELDEIAVQLARKYIKDGTNN